MDHTWMLCFILHSKNAWIFLLKVLVFLDLKEVNQTLDQWIATFEKYQKLHMLAAFCPKDPMKVDRAIVASPGRLSLTGPVFRMVPTWLVSSLLPLWLLLVATASEGPRRSTGPALVCCSEEALWIHLIAVCLSFWSLPSQSWRHRRLSWWCKSCLQVHFFLKKELPECSLTE